MPLNEIAYKDEVGRLARLAAERKREFGVTLLGGRSDHFDAGRYLETTLKQTPDEELKVVAVDGNTRSLDGREFALARQIALAPGRRQLRYQVTQPPKPGSLGEQASGEIAFEPVPGSRYRLTYAYDRKTGAGFSNMGSGISLWRNGAICKPTLSGLWACP